MRSIRVNITKATRREMAERQRAAYQRGDKRLYRRITALLQWAAGNSMETVSQTSGVSRQTVGGWIKELLSQGMESLRYKKGAGRPPKLTKTQKRKLVSLLKGGPNEAGYATACWTSLLVQQLIEREFAVLYNRYYVCELLHNLGFSYQKAKFVSDHLDTEARERWLQETWPEICRVAQEKQAWILFQDEVSFAQWGSLSYTWAPVGEQPVVATSGKRKGYKVWGVIELHSGQFLYQTLTERFNSERYQAFLSYVMAQTDQHILLIQDGARYHTSKSTRAFFAAHAERLTVYQLPSYSPDYNPIEFLWKNVKRLATHNQHFPDFSDLQVAVDNALSYFSQQAQAIKNLMRRYLNDLALLPATP